MVDNKINVKENVGDAKRDLIALLAYDALLYALDDDYDGVSENELIMIKARNLEIYGRRIGDTEAQHELTRKQMIEDIHRMKDEMTAKIRGEERNDDHADHQSKDLLE